ncbi:putative transmembrane protein, partial [Toxoplasma gondii TgCatPRC2]
RLPARPSPQGQEPQSTANRERQRKNYDRTRFLSNS